MYLFFHKGIFLNIISVIILSRKPLRKTTMGFYNIVLAIINGSLMIIIFWFSFPSLYFRVPHWWSVIYCKTIVFLSRGLADLSSWVNVMFCFDRMICIAFPRRFKIIKNKIFLFSVLLFMILIIAGVNFQSFEYDVVISYRSNSSINQNGSESDAVPVYTCTASENTKLTSRFIDTIFRVTLPFLFSIILDTILIYNLTTVKKKRWLKRDEMFARSVIALNFLYMITNLPYMIVGIYLNILTYNGDFTSPAYLIASLALSLSTVLASCNFAFPLIVNLIFFKAFRREFFFYFTRWKFIGGSVRPSNSVLVTRKNKMNTMGGISMITMNRSMEIRNPVGMIKQFK
jgi:hypothetical protein